jgi:transcriptional regulator with XRE-family HTH domain
MKRSSRTRSKRLPHKLLQIRQALNLSQGQLLTRLGFADDLFSSNISQYENGKRVPSLVVVLRYARVAGVTMEEIVDDKLNLPKVLPGKISRLSTQSQRG